MRQVSFKLIEFNVYDDNNTKSDNFNKYRDNREFMVQMFGINSKGQTASIYVEGFNPFFYVKVDDSWDNSKKTCFVNEIKAMMGPYYEDSIIKSQFVEKKNLYGFDAGKLHNFIVIIFKNTMALNKAKKLWYKEIITETTYTKFLKPKGYIFEDTSVYLYEGHIPPLLRLFHIREISPSGWIALPESRYLKHDKLQKTTYCDYEYTINYRYIVPLEKNVLVPYKQCSFDIEASSSHGDFPLAIKHYKKLAMDIVNRLYYEKSEISDKHNKSDKSDKPEKNQLVDEETLKQMILTAFKVPVSVDFPYPEINVVYPKKKVSRAEITKLFNDFIMMYPATIKVNKNDTDDDIALANGAVDDDDSDEEDDVTNQEIAQNTELEEAPSYFNKKKVRSYTNRKATILDILNDQACEYTTQIKELSKTLTHIFPQLEGDKVTFIGSSFKKYGEDRPYLNHCIVLNGCVIPEGAVENSVIVTCDTEREVLLEWTKLIQAENPDIVTGYNITTFDFPFMDDRSQELNCRQEFLKLSRNRDEVCLNRNWKTGEETLETNKIVLASGEYSLKYIKMTGRLIVDLYIHFRKEYQLPSNKLDAVSGHFIGDDVNSIEHVNIGQGKTIIKTKNLKGLDVGGYVNFLEISYSEDFYKKGKKFMITNINMESHEFTISGIEHLDMTKKVRWGLAKDDVSPQDIFRLSNGSDEDRGIVAKYCIKDCTLVQNLMDKIDLLTGYVEMAGYCSVPMSFLVFRGQGIKLTSYVAKKCREKDTLMPTIEKAENDGGYEGAIVLPPKCDIYLEDPVACVDYSSLYPSSIISENISHDSKVWTCEYNLEGEIIKECGERNEDGTYRYDNLPEYKYVDVTYDTYHYIRKTLKAAITKERCGYKICRFAQFPDGKAILPSILEELLVARKTTKKLMAKEEDPFMKNVYNKRQETIKVTANSVYGQTGARTSTFYDKDVAASTTATGRKLLIYARTVIETGYKNRVVKLKNEREVKTNAEYVYGDSIASYTPIYIKINNIIEILTVDSIGEKYGNNEWFICQENGKEEKEYCDLTKNPDIVILTWTDNGWTVLKTIIKHRLNINKKMFRILTHTGLVDVTDDHSLLTCDGKEISPNNVDIGTELLHRTIDFADDNLFNNKNVCTNIDEAKVYGFFFGDGSCGYYDCHSGKKASWALNNKNMDIINKYLNLCKNVFPEFEWCVYDTIKSSNVYKLSFNISEYGKKVIFIKNFRLKTYYKNSKIIPSFILNSPLEIRNAFWEGLYDADGDKDKNGYIRIDQKSQISASNICLLANSIGYKTSINIRSDKPDIYRITCTKIKQRKNPNAIKKIVELQHLNTPECDTYVYDLTTENHHFAAGIGNMIVHNTDSVFFKFNLKDLDGNKIANREALEITIELAKDAGQLATKYLKAPHDLEYEKTFLPFILLSKKRYVGMLYEDDPDKGKIKFMGIVLKRRDNAPIVKDIYGGIIDKIIKERSMEKAIRYCKECLQNMVNEVYPIEKLMITKALRGYYKNPKQIAHNVLANRIGEREQGNRPTAGDRIKYVYIQTDMKHALQGDKIETPEFIVANSLKINYAFYITNQIMKPILQLFALGLEDMPAFKKRHGHSLSKWYNILIELQIKWDLDEDKFAKKLDELKGKEVKALVFDEYLNMLR